MNIYNYGTWYMYVFLTRSEEKSSLCSKIIYVKNANLYLNKDFMNSMRSYGYSIYQVSLYKNGVWIRRYPIQYLRNNENNINKS